MVSLEELSNIEQVKGILIDVDGTLVNSDKELTEPTVKAVKKLYQHGFEVGLCTGRAYPIVKNYILSQFPSKSIHVVDDGGQIVSAQGEIEWQQLIPGEMVKKLCLTTKKLGGEYGLTIDQTFYYTPPFYQFIKDIDIWDKEMKLAHDFKDWATTCIHLYNIDEEKVRPIVKLLDLTNYNIIRNKNNKLDTDIQTNSFHITAEDVDKGTTAERWAKMKGLELRKEVMMIGDGYNDIAVMKKAGFKVVMKNAVTQLKQQADLVIGHTDHNGLANFIKQFLMELKS
jgi:hypothetical protein